MTGPNKRIRRRRAADAAPIVALLDPSAPAPLHRQIYDALRAAILAGRVSEAARLPSTRALAQDLGVSRNTVTLAFDQLRSEGYISAHRGGGTRVRCAAPESVTQPSPMRGALPRATMASLARTPQRVRLPARGAALVESGRLHVETPRPRAFELGVPALDAFPWKLWSQLHTRRSRRGGGHLGDGLVTGDPALQQAVHAHVTSARGVRCAPEQVFIVNGAQHAIDLVSRVLLDRDDAVWMEDPGYLHARISVHDAGARIVPVPVDAEGLDVAEGERRAPDARMAYVTPSHQFPLGAVMSAQRRMDLLAWAHRADAWILEDDYDSEFRYSGRPLPSLQGLDVERCNPQGHARVLYVGTFSKTLAPGFRLGYLVVPEVLVESLANARRALDRYAPTLEQGVLADFIGDGHYARHLRRMRALYEERQGVLLQALREQCRDDVEVAPDAAGLHLVAWLRHAADASAIGAAAAAEGVSVSPLSRYRIETSSASREALLLNYAGFDTEAIRQGVAGLQRAFRRRGG